MKSSARLLLSCPLLLASTAASAATLEVPSAFADIPAAIAGAAAGDTIVVSTNGGAPYSPFSVSGATDLTIVSGETGVLTGAYGVGYSTSIAPVVTVDGGGGDCVEIDTSVNTTIAGFVFLNCSTGVFEQNSSGTHIFGNVFYTDNQGYSSVFATQSVFASNELRNAGSSSDGVLLQHATGVKVIDNTVRGYLGQGIFVSDTSQQVVVLNNDVQQSGGFGIVAGGVVSETTVARNLTLNNNGFATQIFMDAASSFDGEAVGNNTAGLGIVVGGTNTAAQND
ncbi:MAG: right-handed parallel beta-helix repeat-containing protein [Myxococcota bacterium]